MKQKLEIIIIPLEKFAVNINGKNFGEFTLESSWEGLIKLVNDNGEFIIVTDDLSLIEKTFSDIFGKEKQSNYTVVKLSSSLIS